MIAGGDSNLIRSKANLYSARSGTSPSPALAGEGGTKCRVRERERNKAYFFFFSRALVGGIREL